LSLKLESDKELERKKERKLWKTILGLFVVRREGVLGSFIRKVNTAGMYPACLESGNVFDIFIIIYSKLGTL